MRIFKYPLQIEDTQTIILPLGYKVLSVQEQNGVLTMWCLVDELSPKTAVTVQIYGTGHPANTAIYEQYIGTVQMSDGLVWHVFINK